MSEPDLDVVGIGNAIVDVIADANDDLLDKLGLVKGTMALIDAKRAEELYAGLKPRIERSGGSAANTMFGPATGRCLVLVTPDAQRTMQTYLGACAHLTPDDIDEKTVARAKVAYLEGYLWDPPAAKAALRKAADISHQAGRSVALTLSDRFCVERHRREFLQLIAHRLLFGQREMRESVGLVRRQVK